MPSLIFELEQCSLPDGFAYNALLHDRPAMGAGEGNHRTGARRFRATCFPVATHGCPFRLELRLLAQPHLAASFAERGLRVKPGSRLAARHGLAPSLTSSNRVR